jgi:hypothetical protein
MDDYTINLIDNVTKLAEQDKFDDIIELISDEKLKNVTELDKTQHF